jgi:hypothetical protein
MSEGLIALSAAMGAAAAAAAGAAVAPVSIQFDWLCGDGPAGDSVGVSVKRVTKTLVFVQGVLVPGGRTDAGSDRLAAAGVFKILPSPG